MNGAQQSLKARSTPPELHSLNFVAEMDNFLICIGDRLSALLIAMSPEAASGSTPLTPRYVTAADFCIARDTSAQIAFTKSDLGAAKSAGASFAGEVVQSAEEMAADAAPTGKVPEADPLRYPVARFTSSAWEAST